MYINRKFYNIFVLQGQNVHNEYDKKESMQTASIMELIDRN